MTSLLGVVTEDIVTSLLGVVTEDTVTSLLGVVTEDIVTSLLGVVTDVSPYVKIVFISQIQLEKFNRIHFHILDPKVKAWRCRGSS